ncbi:MAG: GDSL-type esterase/lipase family protein [Eubacteriales bacterium]
MNKLDAISRRGSGMHAVVRLIKAAITGVCACALIASSTQLNFGSVTYALDDTETAQSRAAGRQITAAHASPTADTIQGLDEAAVMLLFPNEPEPEQPATVYERPGAVRPEEYKGNAVTFDENGNVLIYGTAVTAMTAKTPSGTPDESAAVSDDYFRDAVFVGNSLLVGMQKAAVLDTTFYANIGLSVKQFFEKAFIPSPDGETAADGSPVLVTAAEALARDNSFRRVYLMFGINELGWPNVDPFISQYETLIDTILTIRPDAVIYVQAILPVNETVAAASGSAADYCTNTRITAFNTAIAAMAARKNVVFLTPGDVLIDSNGQLNANATTDGIHLSGAYIKLWKNYLATHAVDDIDASVFYTAANDETSDA